MSAAPEVWTVLLAAGGSRRLGRPKQALELNGQNLLERAVAAAEALTPGRVICVLGAWRPVQPPGCRTVINPDWREGMASSLLAGVREVPASAGVLLMLCDQPAVGEAELARLLEVYRNNPQSIVAADYGDRAGVPALFPPQLRSRLLALRGDWGARELLKDPALLLERVPLPEARLDIDTPSDWERWRRGQQN